MDLQNPVFDPLQNIGNRPKIGAKPENRRIEGRKLPYNLGIDFYLIRLIFIQLVYFILL